MFFNKCKLADYIILIALCALCFIFIFNKLDTYSVRMWDEARNGINALEMLRNKNFLVTHFRGIPDMWNTKPPLLIWLITASFSLFGPTEFALRLPSALAASSVIITIYLFSSIILKDRLLGLFSSLILFTSFGFFDNHIARTGDYDALLTLMSLLATLFTFQYLQTWKKKQLIIATVFWILAVFTKGVAGLLFVPGILLYVVVTKKFKKLSKQISFWRAILAFGIIVLGYYLLRHAVSPGYLQAVWQEELFGRVTRGNESATNMLIYYWRWFAEFRFQHWVYFVPISIGVYPLISKKMSKKFLLFSYLLTISFYLIISITQTKNLWYDAQLYPYLSLLVAQFSLSIFRKIPFPLWIIPALIITFYLQRYLRTNLAYINRPDVEDQYACHQYGYFFRNNPLKVSRLVGVHQGAEYCMPFYFYHLRENIPVKTVETVEVGDTVLTCDEATEENLKERFNTHTDKESEGCYLIDLQQ